MPAFFVGKVRDLSHKGLGVVDHPDGRTFFCRGTWPGDLGEFEIHEHTKKYDEIKLLRILKSSDNRIEPVCPHRGIHPGQCGGCPWMIANYDSQITYKLKRLKHALEKRNLKFDDQILKPVIKSKKILGYRNRVQLKTNGEVLGYVSEASSVLAPVQNCLIMNEKLNVLFDQLKSTLPKDDFKPTQNHNWCFIDIDDEMGIDEVKINKRRPFRQGNTEQNEVMKKWVEEKFSNIPRHYPVIDLFCGSGNFTEVLSRMGFENILAVEVQGIAIQILKDKKLSGVRVLELDMLQKGNWAMIARLQPHAKAILIDPPREGIGKRKGLFKYLDNLEEIFYVSCELDSYSRDIVDIISHGWSAEEIIPIDLFPHTPHIEIMSSFKKQ